MESSCKNSPPTKKLPCNTCAHAPVCLDLPNHYNQLQEKFQSVLHTKQIKPGQHLCHQGQPSPNLFILKSGLLKSYVTKANGQEFVMSFVLPSDLFGWEGFDKPRHAISVVALTESHVCMIESEKIFEITQYHPSFTQKLLRMISRRVHHDNIALLRTSAVQRVSTFLLQLTARYRDLGYPSDRCQLLMSQQDIANYLRINPSTISRTLHDLQNSGIIEIDKNSVLLNDIPQLRKLAEMEPRPHKKTDK